MRNQRWCIRSGVVRSAVSKHPEYSINEIAELIKKTAFKITRMGQLVGVEASRRLGVDFGIVDLSLAPTRLSATLLLTFLRKSVLSSAVVQAQPLALRCLMMQLKRRRNGIVICRRFIGCIYSVSEDAGMINAARSGALTIEKLEAMTAVCSVGLDMIVIPVTQRLRLSAVLLPMKQQSVW